MSLESLSVEIIIIGNEILQGKRADAHVQWLAKQLASLGLTIAQVQMVTDEIDAIKNAWDLALQRSDLIITTGGLGPTEDDCTKEALSRQLNEPVQENKIALKIAQMNYARRGREFDSSKSFYHQIPTSALVFNNPTGFAPGLGFFCGKRLVLCAPGVPHELHSMMEQEFVPLIKKHFLVPKNFLESFSIRTHGVGEEKIFKTLCPSLWKDLSLYGSVSSLPHFHSVDIEVNMEDTSLEKVQQKKLQLEKFIKNSPLYEFVWQLGTVSLEEYVVHLAKGKKVTISLAESCTGGLVSSFLTDVPGSSQVVLGGVVSYTNPVKEKILKVSAKTLQEKGAVSSEVACQMAQGVREQTQSHIGLSVTGIAGPDGGSAEKPVGTVFIGISTAQQTFASRFDFSGTRSVLKERFCREALFLLLDEVKKITV